MGYYRDRGARQYTVREGITETGAPDNVLQSRIPASIQTATITKIDMNNDFAAMLGFVIDKKVNDCVTRICKRIYDRSTEINLEEYWEKEERFGKHSHLYRTCHRQVDHNNNLITILHLFVDH